MTPVYGPWSIPPPADRPSQERVEQAKAVVRAVFDQTSAHISGEGIRFQRDDLFMMLETVAVDALTAAGMPELEAEVARLRATAAWWPEYDREMTAHEATKAEVARLTALDGATEFGTEGAWPADAGEFAARWNARDVEQRNALLGLMVTEAQAAQRCFMMDHEGAMAERDALRTQVEAVRAVIAPWSRRASRKIRAALTPTERGE